MGLLIREAPLLLLSVLADIAGGGVPITMVFLGSESQRGKQQSQRTGFLPKGTDQEKHLLSSTMPAQPGTSF